MPIPARIVGILRFWLNFLCIVFYALSEVSPTAAR